MNKDYEMIFIKPVDFVACTECVEAIKNGKILFVNLDDTDRETSQRILDFISGAAYIKNATIEMPAESVLCVIPKNIEYQIKYRNGKYNMTELEELTEE